MAEGSVLDSQGPVQAGGIDERVCREVDESDHQQRVVQGERAERLQATQGSDDRELERQPADDEATSDDDHRLDDVLLRLAERL